MANPYANVGKAEDFVTHDQCLVQVYIDDGRVFEYGVSDSMKGREHASAIINTGYRHTTSESDLEWYPPHRITKIKVKGGAESTMYRDSVRAT